MLRKTKATPKTEGTNLARATNWPFAGFEEMDRWFDDFRRSFEQRSWGPQGPWGETGLLVREPLVDVIDKGSEFLVRAELPGVAKEDLDLNVTDDGIEIKAESNRSREEREKNYYFQERSYQALHRFLSFPDEVKPDLASASFKDGILAVRVPKKEPTQESKPVKVRVE